MKIETKYSIGSIVYFLLCKEQNPMIVISIWIKDKGVSYECRDVNSITNYFNEFELTETENILTKIK